MPDADRNEQTGELFQDLITSLTILKKNIGIYPQGHTTINRTTSNLLDILRAVFEKAPVITIAATKKTLSLNGSPIEAKTQHIQDFALFLNQRGIASLRLEKGITAELLHQFYRLALAIPTGVQLYQAKDIEQQINALETITVTELDFSSVLLSSDGTPESDLPLAQLTTLWQDFMLGSLPPELQHDRASAFSDTTPEYNQDSFKEFCQKYNVTPSQVIESYENILKESFSAVDEQCSGVSAKQSFLKSMQEALGDLSDELKNQLLNMTFNHMNVIQDESLIEEILFSMPGEMILETLKGAPDDKKEISPSLAKLLGSLSRIPDQQQEQADTRAQLDDADRDKIRELLSKEHYDKYVPDDYAKTLQNISSGLLSKPAGKPCTFDTEKHTASLQAESLNRDITVAFLSLMNGNLDEELYGDLCAKISRMVPDLMQAGEYDLLATVYKTLAQHASDKKQPACRNAAAAAIEAFSQEHYIALLADAFFKQAGMQNKALEDLVLFTGTKNLEWLIKHYVQQFEGSRGQQLFTLLCRFGARAAEEAVTILPRCNEKQTIALLKLVRNCGDNACIPPVRKLLASSSADLRLEALRTLLKIKDPSAVPILKKMLYAKDSRSVDKALSFVQENAVQELALDLANMIKTRYISQSRLNRNRAVLKALGTLRNVRVLPVLQKKASVFFSFTPAALRQTQSFLYTTLTEYPRESVEGLILQGLRSGNLAIRKFCQGMVQTP